MPELAGIAGMSSAGFVRRFAQLTGATPLNYLTEWRMHVASKALKTTQDAIKTIGLSLGYSSESAFSTAFKRVYGCSPIEHRRLNRGKREKRVLISVMPASRSKQTLPLKAFIFLKAAGVIREGHALSVCGPFK